MRAQFVNEALKGLPNEALDIKTLVNRYEELDNVFNEEHWDAYMNTDNPIESFGYLLGDSEGFKEEFKEWLRGQGVSDYTYREVRAFTKKHEEAIDKALKKNIQTARKEQNKIFNQLAGLFPVLTKLPDQMQDDSPILGTAISRQGHNWSITTPNYYNDDIDLTTDEALEYKKFLKAKGIKKSRKKTPYPTSYYD